MFIISLVIPAETYQEQLTYVLFWGVATLATLTVMLYFGNEIVDKPKLSTDNKTKKEFVSSNIQF